MGLIDTMALLRCCNTADMIVCQAQLTRCKELATHRVAACDNRHTLLSMSAVGSGK